MINFVHLKQQWKWARVWPLLLCLPICGTGVYLPGPGSVVVILGLDFSNLNMQMLNAVIWDNSVLECDLKHLLEVAHWNSAPETDCAIHTVNRENRRFRVKA